MSARTYWQIRADDEKLWRIIGYMPDGRISLYRWSEYHRLTYSDAMAKADSGALPGYIAEGRWIALDLSVEPIELRLKLSGWHFPKRIADDLYVTPQGNIRVKAKPGD